MEVDLLEGRGAGQADAPGRRRPDPAAAAELLHGASRELPTSMRRFSIVANPDLNPFESFCYAVF